MLENKKLKLKHWRVLKEISREQLAEATQLTSRTIYNYETDVNNLRKASYETLLKLANALDISVDDIFLDSISENPKLERYV